MKTSTLLSILSLVVLLYSCGDVENESTDKEDAHAKALASFNSAVKEYNNAVEDVCNCLHEKGNIDGCMNLYNNLSFSPTQEMVDHLSDEEYNLEHVEKGIENISQCEAEIGLE